MADSRKSLVAMAALLVALSGCGEGRSDETAEAPSATPVLVAAARPASGSHDVVAYGMVRSDKEAVLSFKIGGLIKSLKADTGDKVAKGQLLAELDQREIDAQLKRATAAAEKARRDLARIEPLVKKGFVSTQKEQDARSALDMALADRQAVEFNRSLARIVAPADGVVLSRHADINEIVGIGAPVLTVSQGSEGYILKAGLSDRDVARLTVGDSAKVTLDAFPGTAIDGAVRRKSATSDARTGTFEVEIQLSSVPSGVESGFMGEARITPKAGAGTPRLAIPASAILEGHGSTATVYMLDPATSTVRLTRIGIAAIRGDEVIIADGLQPGTEVVSAGAPYLRDGATVKVVTDLADLQPKAGPRT
ncbi:MAG TPA: efflux RND transporter periplasmic adaptor subunit [Parvibaculum sp.]|uniref:efflux RND transporter periplasmic adaptor subunit n=1 Tax=Parvibaculum sp. TaxID=2024848 RepID=UPI002CA024FD|nr:efflux RND transporter periplasmic adaptor subunit [Parvibaculum sp.]HMM13618.1 efflux RND transporter periplasmic adaptor subunit [Parvibaculum sp.]